MTEKMLDSTHQGMRRSSSNLPSMYGKDFLELVKENGQIHVQGGSSNRTPHNPSCDIGYSTINTSPRDESTGTAKRTRLNTLCSNFNQSSDQDDMQFSQNKSFNKLKEEFAKESTSSHLRTYSSQQCLPSSPPLKKPIMDHSSQAPEANSKKLKYLGKCDQRTAKVNNFSNFLVPKVFLKSTQPTRKASLAKLEEIEAAKGSKGLTGFQDLQTPLTANKSTLVVARSNDEPPLDENSEAVYHNIATLKAKGKANSNLCNETLLPSSPACSLEASNDPNFCIKKHEDSDESTYLSDNDEEAEEDVVVKETPAREGNSVKRRRNAETHNLYEKERRDKMNKKMRILKELIPNCNKMDKASLLDDAIKYLKSLKLQLQIMSMGSGLCMPQMMLPQLIGAGMGFRPSTGINPWSPPQFPIAPLSGIKDNTLQNMFGFSNQMPHIPIYHHAPNFIPMMIGNNSSTQQLVRTTIPTNLPKHLANSSQLTTLDVSDLHAKAELCGTNQAENQASLNHIPSYPFYFPTNKEEKK